MKRSNRLVPVSGLLLAVVASGDDEPCLLLRAPQDVASAGVMTDGATGRPVDEHGALPYGAIPTQLT